MIKERTELATPHLSGLLDFWLTKCIGDKPPVSSTIAPADLRPWKDNIVIFEVIGEDDFVYSYYGKALAAAFGHSRLGATLDELPEEQRAILRPEYASVLRERLPVARVYTADFGGITRSWERLALPMSSDGELIDKLLVAAYELTDGKPAPAEEEPPGETVSPCAPCAPEKVPSDADADTGSEADGLDTADVLDTSDTAEMDDAGRPAAAEDDPAMPDAPESVSSDDDPTPSSSTDLKPGAPA